MKRVDEATSADSDWHPPLFKDIVHSELIHVETFLAKAAWTRTELDRAARKGRIFLFQCEGCEFVPRFFCDERFDRNHVLLISALLGSVSPGGKLQFFMTGKGSLGGLSPLIALARGQFRHVRRAAQAFAQR